jgi:peptide-methionine (S)-S-oxide reductase
MFKPRISASLILSLLFSAALLAGPARADTAEKGLETAIFAGGCFWCVESDFDKVPGVVKTISGFSGGVTPNPTYKQVVTEITGHREVVQITFDPKKVTYAHLVDVLFHSVDPTDGGGQFCDRGQSYSTAIYATTPEQKKTAEAVKKKLQDSGVLKKPIVTPIEDAGPFFPAEEYHQDFYTKSPVRYKFYRFNCGRNARVQALWGENAHKGIAKH